MRRVTLAGLLALASCGKGASIEVARPVDRAFVPSGAPVLLEMRAEGVSRLVVRVDGEDAVELPGTDSDFRGLLPGLTRGRHVITVIAPEIPGLSATREVFADRMPDAGIGGYGYTGADWMLTLSGTRPSSAGRLAGRLSLLSVSTASVGALSRILSETAFAGEVSAASDPAVGWIDAGGAGTGTLHVEAVAGDVSSAAVIPAVHAFSFSPSGLALAAFDDGLMVLSAPFGSTSARRVADRSDGAAFLGSAEDVLSIRLDDAPGSAHVTIAGAPAYSPVAVAPAVAPSFAASAQARTVAMRLAESEGFGPLLLYSVPFESSALLFGGVSAAGFSPDGVWLYAITGAGADGAGTLVLQRILGPPATRTFAGAFVAATFDATSQNAFGLESDGTLAGITLGLASSVRAPIAPSVAKLAVLPGGALVWQDLAGGLWVRRTDGAIEAVGALNGARAEVDFSPDGSQVAFTALAADGGRPVRRVDLVTGQIDDFGVDAHRGAFLADGAFAWAETRADAESGGLANDDLWMFPAFPQAVGGLRQIATRVAATDPFDVSPDGTQIAVLTDLPRRGQAWSAEARCFDTHLRQDDLGPADGDAREIRFRADARVLWFAPGRTLYLSRCRPQ